MVYAQTTPCSFLVRKCEAVGRSDSNRLTSSFIGARLLLDACDSNAPEVDVDNKQHNVFLSAADTQTVLCLALVSLQVD